MSAFPRLRIGLVSVSGLILIAIVTLAFTGAGSRVSGGFAPTKPGDPKQAMIAALGAAGPHPSLGAEARTFDRFVGKWACHYTFHLADGSVRTKEGEINFGWVLDGRAVQDIWTTYPTRPGEERKSGTSFRFFDAKSKQWRVIFIQPEYGVVLSVAGGMEGDRLVLRGTDTDANPIRWTFYDITDNSFNWRGETSHDGGKTFTVDEEHRMRRRNG
jgi:hypothetical protein